MGIVGKRKQNEESVAVSGNGQRVWMENCVRCGCPITILAVARPSAPMCGPCTIAAAAEAADAESDDD
jgi:hypothetical protein